MVSSVVLNGYVSQGSR